MPNVKILNMQGAEVGQIELSDKVFGAEVNGAVLHSAVRAYLMNQRQGTQSTLTRTEVSGGGKKPWRQKGTGRARQGSTRAPQWTHGGIALGPKPRTYHVTLNKKTKRVAMISALSDKVANDALVVVDSIQATEFKTKTMVEMLKALGATKTVTQSYKAWGKKAPNAQGELERVPVSGTTEKTVAVKTLIVTDAVDEKIIKSFANIPTATTTLSGTINVYEILNAEKVIITEAAVKKLEEVYGA